MIRTITGDNVREYTGLSTDTKPTEDVWGGSTFLEVDTKKIYIFNEDTSTWVEW